MSAFDQPGSPWHFHGKPEEVGYCSKRLANISAYAECIPTHAAVAVVNGKIVWEYGDTTIPSYIKSVRKSVLSMLYGNYVANGTIDLDLTLADLGIDDVQGLLPIETQATVKDIITARSGIYHPASNSGDDTTAAPERGSKKPGEYFLYNNWDFNAAGAIFEKLSGLSIYDSLSKDLAEPLGFEHWNRESHKKTGDTSRSVHKAYHMALSTRDMARVGELMLQEGCWEGRQLIPKKWVRRMISVVTPNDEMNPQANRDSEFGFGYMWWVWESEKVRYPFKGAYTARGFRGQYITIIPLLKMVVAHKSLPRGEATSWSDYVGILSRLTDARINC